MIRIKIEKPLDGEVVDIETSLASEAKRVLNRFIDVSSALNRLTDDTEYICEIVMTFRKEKMDRSAKA